MAIHGNSKQKNSVYRFLGSVRQHVDTILIAFVLFFYAEGGCS